LSEEHFLINRAIAGKCGEGLFASHHTFDWIYGYNGTAIAWFYDVKYVLADLKRVPGIFCEGSSPGDDQIGAKTFQGYRACQTLIEIMQRAFTE